MSDCSEIAKELFVKIMNAYEMKDTKIQQTFFLKILAIIDPHHFFGSDTKDWCKGMIETYIASYSSTISSEDILPMMVSHFM